MFFVWIFNLTEMYGTTTGTCITIRFIFYGAKNVKMLVLELRLPFMHYANNINDINYINKFLMIRKKSPTQTHPSEHFYSHIICMWNHQFVTHDTK